MHVFAGLAQAVFNTTIAIAALERDAAGVPCSHETHIMLHCGATTENSRGMKMYGQSLEVLCPQTRLLLPRKQMLMT